MIPNVGIRFALVPDVDGKQHFFIIENGNMKKATADQIPFLTGDGTDTERLADLTKGETLKIIPDTDTKDSILPKLDNINLTDDPGQAFQK